VRLASVIGLHTSAQREPWPNVLAAMVRDGQAIEGRTALRRAGEGERVAGQSARPRQRRRAGDAG